MGLFGRNKTSPLKSALTDPFAAIPLKPDDVDVRRDSRGNIHLRRRHRLTGLGGKVADLLGYDYSRKLELDEHGTLYYGLVDGETSLETIVEKMARETKRSRPDVEQAVILFTKKLMTLNMIRIKIPARVAP